MSTASCPANWVCWISSRQTERDDEHKAVIFHRIRKQLMCDTGTLQCLYPYLKHRYEKKKTYGRHRWAGSATTFHCSACVSEVFRSLLWPSLILCHLCTHHCPRSYLFSQKLSHEIKEMYAWASSLSTIFHGLHSPYIHHVPAFSKINQNRSFYSAECDSQAVSLSPPWAGQLSLFFKLKHDLLWILTCDKLYTLLITCQLERWSCAF